MFTKIRKYCKSQKPRKNFGYRPWKFFILIFSNKYGAIIILFIYYHYEKFADGRMCALKWVGSVLRGC